MLPSPGFTRERSPSPGPPPVSTSLLFPCPGRSNSRPPSASHDRGAQAPSGALFAGMRDQLEQHQGKVEALLAEHEKRLAESLQQWLQQPQTRLECMPALKPALASPAIFIPSPQKHVIIQPESTSRLSKDRESGLAEIVPGGQGSSACLPFVASQAVAQEGGVDVQASLSWANGSESEGWKAMKHGITNMKVQVKNLMQPTDNRVTRLEREESHLNHQLQELKEIALERSKTAAVDHGDPQTLQGMLRCVKTNKAFEYFICVMIFFNAGSIGAQAHWRMSNIDAELPLEFRVLECLFTVVFALELLLRVTAEGRYFLSFAVNHHNVKMNVFDSVIVLSAVAEELSRFVSEDMPDVSALRLLRFFRLVRVIRIIRVMRFFRDLRVMVAGIMSSGKSLIWAMVLLSLIMFMFGVLFMQVIAESLATESDRWTLEMRELVAKYYGTLWSTLYTLFMSIVGGINWSIPAEALFVVGWPLVLCFVFYVSFGIFCVLNIVTGVFVENATAMTAKDEDHMILEQLTHRREQIAELRELFNGAGASEDGLLKWEEFERHFGDLRVQAYFRKLGVDVDGETAAGIFQLFDFDKKGFIDSDDLLAGIQHIHGNARAVDMYRIDCRLKNLERRIWHMVGDMPRASSSMSLQ